MGSHCVETQIYILISPVYLLYIPYDTCTACGHGGKKEGDTGPDVRRHHIAWLETEIMVMSDDNSPVRVAQYYLCPHVYQPVNKEEPALEHLLVDKYAAFALRGHHEHDTQEIRGETGPRSIGYSHYGAVQK